ncbi:4'-phosphopantetheinyl transferase superfamily protein [Streptomyces sp. ISL-11]|uniref:4'-phosphopantetheinyl transferase family protein n=1 Tax=Streptomyces sp. ISL-11 TaxID=2819174 RepID=UPI001BE8273E|nr:4'-phosphopantetheinyl transferase superfamily protein [Streptomyces sp. ISL-11]MBT2383355.1 4'-phosphopantetheinyl transferase superfamily protein [Streptomyces sp. ISL-11]
MTGTRCEPAPGVWIAAGHGHPPAGLCTPADRSAALRLAPARRAEHLAGRALLRTLLAERFPDARDADVVHTAKGRPELAGHPDIGISVSHDGDTVAACAARHRAVGVDVQHPPRTVADSLLRRCVRAGAEDLARLPAGERAREFTWVWTVQEACVKAEGTGLSGAPWAVDVPAPAASGTWGAYTWTTLRTHSATPLSCAFTTVPRRHARPEAA